MPQRTAGARRVIHPVDFLGVVGRSTGVELCGRQLPPEVRYFLDKRLQPPPMALQTLLTIPPKAQMLLKDIHMANQAMLTNNSAAEEEMARRTAELSLGTARDAIGPASIPDPLGEIADSDETREQLDRRLEEEGGTFTFGSGLQKREFDALTVVKETAFHMEVLN